MPLFSARHATPALFLRLVLAAVLPVCCLAALLLAYPAAPCQAGATCSLHVRDCAEAVRSENRPEDSLDESALFGYDAAPQSSRLPLTQHRRSTTASPKPDAGQPPAASAATPPPSAQPAPPAAPATDDTPGQTPAAQTAPWRSMEDGVEYASLPLPLPREEEGPQIAMLRLHPDKVDFLLCAIGREGHQALTLSEWGERKNLVAAINASMYLPDGTTSTGYMRDGDYTNNGRLVKRFGAFFLAGPDREDLPRATVIDKTRPDWKEMLSHYRLVIQNYRLVDANRQVLWNRGGPWYSISAIGQDGQGNILFLHCREPIEAATFARGLLEMPLDVRTVMYVEGGGQAGLLLRSRLLRRELAGRKATDFLATGNLRSPLPNVLGARRRCPREQTPGAAGQTPAPVDISNKKNY